MKVLLTTGVYPPAIGGPATQTYQLARALESQGIAVTVASFGDDTTDERRDGIRVLSFQRGMSWPGKIGQYLRAAARLIRFVRRERPDLIHHVSGCDYLCVVVGVVARLAGVPTVAKYAGDLVWETLVSRGARPTSYEAVFTESVAGRVLTWVERFAFNSYDRIWATSDFQRDSLARLVGVSPDRIVVMPNFVEIPPRVPLRPAPGAELTVLAASRFAPWKRVDDVLEGFAVTGNATARLRIAGGGNDGILRRLRERVATLGLASRVDFVGAIPPDQMDRIFEGVAVFVSGAEYEPFGIVLVEAMSRGIPVVAASVGGVPEVIVDGETGILVPVRQPAALGSALRHLLESPEVRARMGEAGRRRAARFDLRRNLPALLAIYYAAIEACQRPVVALGKVR